MKRVVYILFTFCLAVIFIAYWQRGQPNGKSPDVTGNRPVPRNRQQAASHNAPSSAASAMFEVSERYIAFRDKGFEITFEPATLAVTGKTSEGAKFTISDPVIKASNFSIDKKNKEIKYGKLPYDVRYSYGVNGFAVTFIPKQGCHITWPSVKHDIHRTALIMPFNEGSYIPLEDKIWRGYLLGKAFNTTEGLSMPFWGVECGGYTVTYMADDPFYNEISFKEEKGIVTSSFTHSFSDKFDAGVPITYYIHIDKDASPITPAKHFRRYLENSNQIRTLEDKAKSVPRIKKLIGAPHAYIWSSGPITTADIKKGKWIEIAKRIVNDKTGAGAYARKNLSNADWNYLVNASKTYYPYKYLMQEMARILSILHAKDRNFIKANLGDCMNPPASWGGGISTGMIDMLKEGGLDKFVLATAGWEQLEMRPRVAEYAENKGYLLGTYDSFHSIHDPKYAGTDQSWPTAQFDKKLYQTGHITGRDGKPIKGFKQFGYQLSPIAAFPYVKQRVAERFKNVPYSYYFIDCDAFGEYYDDYTPGRMTSQRQDVEARLKRLKWISTKFSVPMGSEGGNYLFAPVISIAEGIFTPVIGWADPDMTNKESKFYLGRYYPPDEPEVFFKPVELKDEYVHLYFDPRFKLPLYEAVFHDSVITSAHWGYPSLKFANVEKTSAITEILYQVPPLYHLNLSEFEKNKAKILKQSRIFGQTHTYSYKYPMTQFEFLTEKRDVQKSVFGRLVLVANYSADTFIFKGNKIPPNGILVLKGGHRQVYTP